MAMRREAVQGVLVAGLAGGAGAPRPGHGVVSRPRPGGGGGGGGPVGGRGPGGRGGRPPAPSLGNGFVYDDVPAIVENPLLHSLANSAHVWVSSYWRAGPLYRPLTVQLFALEWWVGGGAPWPFHLVNIVLYAAVAWLVYRLARRVLPAGRRSGLSRCARTTR